MPKFWSRSEMRWTLTHLFLLALAPGFQSHSRRYVPYLPVLRPHIGLAPASIGHCDSVAGHRKWTPTQRNSNTIGLLICTHVHTPAVPTTINSIHIHSSYSVLRSLLVLLLHTVTPGPDNCSKLVHNASLFTTHSAVDASLCGKAFFSARR